MAAVEHVVRAAAEAEPERRPGEPLDQQRLVPLEPPAAGGRESQHLLAPLLGGEVAEHDRDHGDRQERGEDQHDARSHADTLGRCRRRQAGVGRSQATVNRHVTGLGIWLPARSLIRVIRVM